MKIIFFLLPNKSAGKEIQEKKKLLLTHINEFIFFFLEELIVDKLGIDFESSILKQGGE